MNSPIRPFLKWAGGKMQLVGPIVARLPKGRVLVEPFVGGGAVFLNTDYSHYILNDINADLINVYRLLKEDGEHFIMEVRELFIPSANTEYAYVGLRAKFNRSTDLQVRALLFVYLNCHGFNGLCRYNRDGEFNVPFGRYAQPYFPEAEMRAYAAKLRHAELHNEDFREVFEQAERGQVFYCDPPYTPLSATASFTTYAGRPFDELDHEDLALLAYRAARNGVPVLISNHDLPTTRRMYAKARKTYHEVRRHISCKGDSRGAVGEVLALYPAAGASV